MKRIQLCKELGGTWQKAEKCYLGFYSEISSLDSVYQNKKFNSSLNTAVSDNEQMTILTEVTRNLYQMSG